MQTKGYKNPLVSQQTPYFSYIPKWTWHPLEKDSFIIPN